MDETIRNRRIALFVVICVLGLGVHGAQPDRRLRRCDPSRATHDAQPAGQDGRRRAQPPRSATTRRRLPRPPFAGLGPLLRDRGTDRAARRQERRTRIDTVNVLCQVLCQVLDPCAKRDT